MLEYIHYLFIKDFNIFMSFLDRFRKKEIPKPEKESVLPDKIIDNSSLEQLLTKIDVKLDALNIKLYQHDMHLSKVDENIIEHLTELMIRKREIPESKKLEAETILKEATNRKEAIDKLLALGVSIATAYRYTKGLFINQAENENVLVIREDK